ncbi:MAG: HEAT repeat domain-containing protein [Deltaproteobacteria bacterium]
MIWPPLAVRRRLLLAGLAVGVVAAFCTPIRAAPASASGLAAAGPAPGAENGEDAEPGGDSDAGRLRSLAGRFGIEHLVSALKAPRLEERLAGIQRLAGLGTRPALHRLVSFALERRAQLGAREWLTLARALAPRAAEEETRVLLAALLNQRAAEPSGPAEAALLSLARGTAALALAASRSEPAVRVLGAALRSGGAAAALARDALLEYPPTDLEALLAAPAEPSVDLARWLGALGDQRAFHPLRAWVRGESAEVRAAAAVALTELGQLETVPLARQWLTSGVPVLVRAAAEIARLTQQPEAGGLLRQELANEQERSERLRRGLEFPSAELLPLALGARAWGPDAASAWTLLGRIGGAQATLQLETGLARPESAFAAAHALSRLPGRGAHAVLTRALAAKVALPVTTRAAALRVALWHEQFESLPARLAELQSSKRANERAAGAWAASLLGTPAALAELASGDAARIEAVADNALWFDDSVLLVAARLLARAAPGRTRDAFSFALLRPIGRAAVRSSLLEALVLEGGAAAPLALRTLASRDEPRFIAFCAAYVSHPDPVLRAHVARGLGESARASAVGPLARRFELETDETVRQAIVWALSGRRGPTVQRTLQLAASLDPSARVRAAARLALGGMALGDPPPSNEFLWAELLSESEPSEPKAALAAPVGAVSLAVALPAPAQAGEPGLLHVVPGLALPVFADAAGLLVVAGVSVHPLALRWR